MSRTKSNHPWFKIDLPGWKKRWQTRSRYIWNRWMKKEKKRKIRHEQKDYIQQLMDEE